MDPASAPPPSTLPAMHIDLAGKVALVTGGGRGIGRSIAVALSATGAKVAVVDLNKAGADAVAAEIGNARAFHCDVSVPADVTRTVQDVEDQLGSCDILVNNAGITRDSLRVRWKDEDWDAVLNVNLRSAFVAIRAASRGLMKRRRGGVVNAARARGGVGRQGA